MFFASKSLCTAVLAISTLIMSSPVYAEANLPFGHFAIKVHLPVEGDCSKREEIQDKDGNKKIAIVHADTCQNYDPFRAFTYQFAGYRIKHPENPYKYGICSVKVFSQPDCEGELLIDNVDVSLRGLRKCLASKQTDVLTGQ